MIRKPTEIISLNNADRLVFVINKQSVLWDVGLHL